MANTVPTRLVVARLVLSVESVSAALLQARQRQGDSTIEVLRLALTLEQHVVRILEYIYIYIYAMNIRVDDKERDVCNGCVKMCIISIVFLVWLLTHSFLLHMRNCVCSLSLSYLPQRLLSVSVDDEPALQQLMMHERFMAQAQLFPHENNPVHTLSPELTNIFQQLRNRPRIGRTDSLDSSTLAYR